MVLCVELTEILRDKKKKSLHMHSCKHMHCIVDITKFYLSKKFREINSFAKKNSIYYSELHWFGKKKCVFEFLVFPHCDCEIYKFLVFTDFCTKFREIKFLPICTLVEIQNELILREFFYWEWIFILLLLYSAHTTKFVKTTLLLKEALKSWFDEIMFRWE